MLLGCGSKKFFCLLLIDLVVQSFISLFLPPYLAVHDTVISVYIVYLIDQVFVFFRLRDLSAAEKSEYQSLEKQFEKRNKELSDATQKRDKLQAELEIVSCYFVAILYVAVKRRGNPTRVSVRPFHLCLCTNRAVCFRRSRRLMS